MLCLWASKRTPCAALINSLQLNTAYASNCCLSPKAWTRAAWAMQGFLCTLFGGVRLDEHMQGVFFCCNIGTLSGRSPYFMWQTLLLREAWEAWEVSGQTGRALWASDQHDQLIWNTIYFAGQMNPRWKKDFIDSIPFHKLKYQSWGSSLH